MSTTPRRSESRPRREPLDTDEELFWRSLMRLTILLPRVLGDDLERSHGLSGTDYTVLMHLSEAPDRCLRMSDLATLMAFSPGRITRIVSAMSELGWVTKARAADDGRGVVAELTPAGFAVVEQAYPYLLDLVRARVFDHLSPSEVTRAGRVLKKVVTAADDARSSRPKRTRAAPLQPK